MRGEGGAGSCYSYQAWQLAWLVSLPRGCECLRGYVSFNLAFIIPITMRRAEMITRARCVDVARAGRFAL